jgi:hypothetical protein
MSDKKYASIHRNDAAGRVEFKGGKAVWQWSQGANDSTSILIRSLDNPELELEKTQRTPIVPPSSKPAKGAQPRVAGGSGTSVGERAALPRDERPDEGETLRQLRALRERSFDPYNRS